MGIIDPIPLVSKRMYTVQHGDTLEGITSRFVARSRWPELVAANQIHKGLVDGPPGVDHMVFQGLSIGENLLIPSSWLAHSAAGTVGLPLIMPGIHSKTQTGGLNPDPSSSQVIDPASVFINTLVKGWPQIQDMVTASFPGFTVPAPYQPVDIANVLAGWIPFLRANGVDVTQPPSSWSMGGWSLVTSLVNNAATLLATAQTASTVFKTIPWLSIPWQQVPWQATVVPGNPTATSDIWSVIAGASHAPLSGSSSGGLFTGAGNFKTMSGVAGTFDPSTTNFGVAPWTNVPFGQVPWGELDPTVLKDTDVQRCMADPKANARLQEMAKYKDCFVGAGPDKLKKYLCPKSDGTYEDLAKCGGEPTPTATTCPAGTTQVQTQGGPACIPSIAAIPGLSGINWNCSPYPDCIGQQIAAVWPAGTPTPCPPPPASGGSWPSCVADLIKQYGGTLPPGMVPQPKAEETKSSTGMYVALGLGAAVLLGGVVYAVSNAGGSEERIEEVQANPRKRVARRY